MKYAPVLIAAAVGLLASCSNSGTGRSPSMAAYNAYDRPATLPTNPANVRVKVSLSTQLAYVMEGDKPLLIMPVGIGTASTPTPSGSFRIFKKSHHHRANSHGYASNGNETRKLMLSAKPGGWKFKGTPMPYWCEFKANYGFHTGWLKPYPSTHGCIRMHHNIAPKFFRLVSNGTPVSIAQSQPEDATHGKGVALAPDAGPLPDFSPTYYLGSEYFTHHKAVKFE
jgi:lipoprotein-anchoring transpeptidase ErfK/SrfK